MSLGGLVGQVQLPRLVDSSQRFVAACQVVAGPEPPAAFRVGLQRAVLEPVDGHGMVPQFHVHDSQPVAGMFFGVELESLELLEPTLPLGFTHPGGFAQPHCRLRVLRGFQRFDLGLRQSRLQQVAGGSQLVSLREVIPQQVVPPPFDQGSEAQKHAPLDEFLPLQLGAPGEDFGPRLLVHDRFNGNGPQSDRLDPPTGLDLVFDLGQRDAQDHLIGRVQLLFHQGHALGQVFGVGVNECHDPVQVVGANAIAIPFSNIERLQERRRVQDFGQRGDSFPSRTGNRQPQFRVEQEQLVVQYGGRKPRLREAGSRIDPQHDDVDSQLSSQQDENPCPLIRIPLPVQQHMPGISGVTGAGNAVHGRGPVDFGIRSATAWLGTRRRLLRIGEEFVQLDVAHSPIEKQGALSQFSCRTVRETSLVDPIRQVLGNRLPRDPLSDRVQPPGLLQEHHIIHAELEAGQRAVRQQVFGGGARGWHPAAY